MNHEIILILKITKVRINWVVKPDQISRTLGFDFECDSKRDFSVYKGGKINGGQMWFSEGKSDFFGSIMCFPENENNSASLEAGFLCTSQLFKELNDKREELAGAFICLYLDEKQSTIKYASSSPHDTDLVFDLREKPHVLVTKFSLAFAPYTEAKKGQSNNGASAI